MGKYWYIVAVEKTFTGGELSEVKDEICRVFDCTDIEVSGGTSFTVYSPFGPEKLNDILRELSQKFRVDFRAGGQIE